jgi:hypothetical protein
LPRSFRFGALPALIPLFILTVCDVLRSASHADNLWQLNLARQIRENDNFAVTLVDANRIFPDLLVASALERATHAVGLWLSGQAFTLCLVAINIGLLFAVSVGITKNFGKHTGAGFGFLALMLCGTNEYFLELLRPGYHTTGSLLAMVWLLWRFLPNKPLTLLDVSFLGALAFSSRLFLTVLIVPCLLVALVGSPRGRRIASTLPLILAIGIGTLSWILLLATPRVYVEVFPSELHLREIGRLPLDFASVVSSSGVRLPFEFPQFYWLMALAAFLVTVASFARQGKTRIHSLNGRAGATFLLSIVIGATSMRAVGYVAHGRIYVLMLPILLAVMMAALEVPAAFAKIQARLPHAFQLPMKASIGVAGALLVVGANLAGVIRSESYQPFEQVPSLLKLANLSDKPGLSGYWASYALSANAGLDVRTIDFKAGPRFWVNNPWEVFRSPGSSTVNANIAYYWVLAYENFTEVGVVNRRTMFPTEDDITQAFGTPSRLVKIPRTPHSTPMVLYIFDQGVNMNNFKMRWVNSMVAHGLDPSGVSPSDSSDVRR